MLPQLTPEATQLGRMRHHVCVTATASHVTSPAIAPSQGTQALEGVCDEADTRKDLELPFCQLVTVEAGTRE